MGTLIMAKGVDAEADATEYAASVQRGLEGVFFLNTNLEKCAHNYAPGKRSGSVVGLPVVSGTHLSCKSSVNFIQTDIVEVEEMTLFVVSRSSGVPAGAGPNPADVQPLLIGNYGSANVGQGNGSGVVMWTPLDNNMGGGGGYDGTVEPIGNQNVQANLAGDNVQVWNLFCTQITKNGPKSTNHTTGRTGNTVIDPALRKRRLSTRTLRLGSGYQATQTGTLDLAVAFIYHGLLTPAEELSVAAEIRAYMARKGVVV